MFELGIKLRNIKNIKNFEHTFEFSKGIYALVGENAVGKSTLMSALASTVYKKTIDSFGIGELNADSSIVLSFNGVIDEWKYDSKINFLKAVRSPKINFNGIYEGSIFSGTRFEDMKNLENLFVNPDFQKQIIKVRDDFAERLSIILHNKNGKYNNLYRLKNMDCAREYKLSTIPYFSLQENGHFISKYKMSSGECMLISLLNFINSTALKPYYMKKIKTVIDDRLFVFIDEVELALHPSSIVRLVQYLENMIDNNNLTVLFSTHSTELIKMIKPRNIFLIENDKGNASITTPCYPQYAIRSLYNYDGNDCTILVEDELSESICLKLIDKFRIKNNLMISVFPIGGWENTLATQMRIMDQNLFGKDKFVFSVLDGDIENQANKLDKYKHLRKLFLPIMSLEKYLYSKLITENDKTLIRIIGNKIFTRERLDTIIDNYILEEKANTKSFDKKFYLHLLKKAESIKIEETDFIKMICEVIFVYEDFSKLEKVMIKFIEDNYSY